MNTLRQRPLLASMSVLAVAAGLLTACGGGNEGDNTKVASNAQARRQALAADMTVSKLDATTLFGWAEKTFPTLFPAGAQNQTVVLDGKTYTIRAYESTKNYLGVSGEDIYGLGPFTGNVLTSFGKLADRQCEVLGQTCLSGIAANGAALAGATVEAKCTGATAVASGLTTTGSDGRYNLAIDAASLPCLLRVTSTGGQALYSVAAGSGSGTTTTANITTMTDLALAYLKGVPGATSFGSYAIADATAYTTAAVQAAGTAVAGTIKTAGVDFTATADLFGGALQLGSSGNAYGAALSQVAGKLGGSLTQAALVDAIVRTTPAQKAAGAVSLSPDLLLKPSAPNCVSLRSGNYRAVYTDVNNTHERLAIDAPAMRVTNSAGVSTALTADGKCRYRHPDGREYSVSDAGVIIARVPTTSNYRAAVIFPEQTHPLSALVGKWNSMTLETTTNEGAIHTSAATVAADGKVTALTYCGKNAGKVQSDCIFATSTATGLPNMSYSVNADGGFNLTNTTDNWIERVFLYRPGSGEMMSATGGHLSLGTMDRALVMQPVGFVSEYWTLNISTQYFVAAGLADSKNTVSSVDVTAGTFSRDAVFNFNTGATRPEHLELNRFNNGFARRVPETVKGSDGSTQTVSEFISLPLRGTGLFSVGVLGTTQSLTLSLYKSTAP